MWELEERHLQEKHQQLKQQLKDQYFLQRHQLLKRHEKVRAEREKNALGGSVSLSVEVLAEIKKKIVCVCVRALCRRWSRCSATTSGWLKK